MSKVSDPPGAPAPARRSSGWLWLLATFALLVLVGVLGTWLQPDVLFEGQGSFASVEVVEHPDGLRELTFDGGPARQSALYPDDPLRLVLPYSRTAMIGPALVAPDARMLFVGLGGGAMPRFVHATHPAARIEVAEIEPLVVQAARDWFGFETDARMQVHTTDGRAFIEAADPGRWDLIVLDAFAEDGVPDALTTREFLEAVRRALAPGGVVAGNLHTAVDEYPGMVATYQAVFEQVVEVDVSGRRQRILLAAGAMPVLTEGALAEAARAWEGRIGVELGLPAEVVAGFRMPDARGAAVLVDGS